MSRVSQIYTVLRVLAICALITSAAIAQSDYGSIGGFAKDPSGAVVPKVKVVISNDATGEQHPVTTNDSGYYTVPNLAPGVYSLTAEAPGFKKFQSKGNHLNANSALSLDAVFTVGSPTETVDVVATAAALQTDSGSVQGEVTGTQIQSQELNGRNPLYMAQTLPGVRGGATMGDFNFAVGGGEPFNDQRSPRPGHRSSRSTALLPSARAPTARSSASPTWTPSRKIQVMTADYSAEYGRAAGGQIRIISKSGTRDFHGSLYEYFRNSDHERQHLDAQPEHPDQLTRQPFRYNNFGGTIGGPVWAPGMNSEWSPEAVLLRGGRLDPLPSTWTTPTQAVPTALMRARQFQRTAGAEPVLLRQHAIYDPDHLPQSSAPRRALLSRITSFPAIG